MSRRIGHWLSINWFSVLVLLGAVAQGFFIAGEQANEIKTLKRTVDSLATNIPPYQLLMDARITQNQSEIVRTRSDFEKVTNAIHRSLDRLTSKVDTINDKLNQVIGSRLIGGGAQ